MADVPVTHRAAGKDEAVFVEDHGFVSFCLHLADAVGGYTEN